MNKTNRANTSMQVNKHAVCFHKIQNNAQHRKLKANQQNMKRSKANCHSIVQVNEEKQRNTKHIGKSVNDTSDATAYGTNHLGKHQSQKPEEKTCDKRFSMRCLNVDEQTRARGETVSGE